MDDLRQCVFERTLNLDYANGGFAQYHQCVGHPRLYRIYRVAERGGPAEELLEVDGRTFGTGEWDKAAAALNECNRV